MIYNDNTNDLKKARRERKKEEQRLSRIRLMDNMRRKETPTETAQRVIQSLHPQKWDNKHQRFVVA